MKNWKLKGNEKLLATIVAMPNIDFTFIMLADSNITILDDGYNKFCNDFGSFPVLHIVSMELLASN